MFKKLLKNERGLTLVELLAVIVILGVISAVAVPSIGNIIQKSKEDAVKADAIAILNAAKLYVMEEDIPVSTNVKIDKQDLLDAKYLENAGTEWSTEPTVTYNSDNKLVLSGKAQAGKVTLTFSNASIEDINNDKSGDSNTTIKP